MFQNQVGFLCHLVRRLTSGTLLAVSMMSCSPQSNGAIEESTGQTNASLDGTTDVGPPVSNDAVSSIGLSMSGYRSPPWFPTGGDFSKSSESALWAQAPLEVYLLANNKLVGTGRGLPSQGFNDPWIWWQALSSCGAAKELSKNLAGEFGDRTKGASDLARAKSSLSAFAASQPSIINLWFEISLGKYDSEREAFVVGDQDARPYSIDPTTLVSRVNATQGFAPIRNGRISTIKAANSIVDCGDVKFQSGGNWVVHFGDRGRLNYIGSRGALRNPVKLPLVEMKRASAEAFVARNPGRNAIMRIGFSIRDTLTTDAYLDFASFATMESVAILDATTKEVLVETSSTAIPSSSTNGERGAALPTDVTIVASGVRLRAEPSTGADVPIVGIAERGQVLRVAGFEDSGDWAWYQVFWGSGKLAFVRSDLTDDPRTGSNSQQGTVERSVTAGSVDVEVDHLLASIGSSSATDISESRSANQMRLASQVSGLIQSQLRTKQCWTNHSDMADAQRLRVVFRVRFGRSGKFDQLPELVGPEAVDDPPLALFTMYARRALDACDQLGWEIPESYFQLPEPRYINVEFAARS